MHGPGSKHRPLFLPLWMQLLSLLHPQAFLGQPCVRQNAAGRQAGARRRPEYREFPRASPPRLSPLLSRCGRVRPLSRVSPPGRRGAAPARDAWSRRTGPCRQRVHAKHGHLLLLAWHSLDALVCTFRSGNGRNCGSWMYIGCRQNALGGTASVPATCCIPCCKRGFQNSNVERANARSAPIASLLTILCHRPRGGGSKGGYSPLLRRVQIAISSVPIVRFSPNLQQMKAKSKAFSGFWCFKLHLSMTSMRKIQSKL